MHQGFVVLSSQDGDVPFCPAIGTCSKEDAADDGGFVIGQQAAENGAIWVDRPYVTGNPTPEWLAGQCDDALEAGAAFVQVLNECNLELEGFQGGPAAYFALEDAVRALVVEPARLLAMPPSPGVPGWQQWVRPGGDHAVHAYGDCAAMRGIVEWYLANTSGRLVITECNWGAGNAVDVDQWAGAELVPFLDWCHTQPRVVACLYFAWVWRGAPPMPTPVDAKGTAVERVVTDWVPPAGGGANGDITLSVPTVVQYAAPENFEAGPRATTRGVVIHTTRGGSGSLEEDYRATVSWFQNPQSGVSAHLVVGPTEVARCLHDSAIGWHCRTANGAWLGLELAQPTISTPLSDFQYQAAAEACRLWAAAYGFPLERVMSETSSGLVGHQDTESGRADGKTDPGVPPAGVFDWIRFVDLCRGAVDPPFDVEAVRGELWAIKDQLYAGGWPRFAQAIEAAVTQSKGEK